MTTGLSVLVKSRDLFFRAKVEDQVRRGGGVPARDAPYSAAVLEVGSTTTGDVEQLVARGIPVIVFGPHVDADSLREFRAAGATAVPNSKLFAAVGELLGYLSAQLPDSGDE